MEAIQNLVVCSKCGEPQNEPPGLDLSQRTPCKCGNLGRKQFVDVAVPVGVHSQVAIKGKRGGKGKPFLEQKVGDDLHRDSGKWKDREMIIDRENDFYKEKIVDKETGHVDRDVQEPLSQHVNRGLARPREQ